MKKIIYVILILCTTIMISACSNSLKEDYLKLTEEISIIKNENESLKSEILKLQESNEALSQEISQFKEKLINMEGMNLVPGQGESLFKIYGANVDTYEKEVITQLILKDELPVKEKLDVIADNLSKAKFDGLGIEIVKIDEVNGKKIAVVNLSEKTNEKNSTWQTGYFQGSTGGAITAVSLHETFLQRDYAGEWVDGVKFLYNNQDIGFEHVEGLSQINYR